MTDERLQLLSRDEMELIRFYRSLSSQKQFDILQSVEETYNAARRMKELVAREVEKRIPCQDELH